MMGPYEIAGNELPGWAALYLLHTSRFPDAINDQIETGPQRKNTSTLLHLAILRQEPVQLIENMILLGAHLSTRDSQGTSPLELASVMRDKTQEHRARDTWHLLNKYVYRQDRCRQCILALYACIRHQGIYKDVARLVGRAVWATRYSLWWS